MKTPREILFERHRPTETKLDAVRKSVIANEVVGERRPLAPAFPVRVVLKLWQELILPCRRTWAGLAAVWIVVFAVHLAANESPSQTMTAASQAPGPGILAALREQRQMLVQLLEPLQTGPADRPKIPGPRGELRIIQFA